MKHLIPLVALCGLALAGCATTGGAKPPIEEGLAALALPEGWACDGEVKQYTPDNLFELINGEAELYLPYGFQRCYEALYAKAGQADCLLATEIYQLGSPLDAFGIYSNYRAPDSNFIEIGADGYQGRTQIVFYQDAYFVKLRESGKPREDQATLAVVAQALSDALPANTAPPAELAMLDHEAIVPVSVKYLAESVMGYRFFARGFTAETNIGDPPTRAFVVLHDTAEEADATLEAYLAHLEEFGAKPAWNDTPAGKVLRVKDPLHKQFALVRAGNHYVGLARIADEERAMALLTALQGQVAGGE